MIGQFLLFAILVLPTFSEETIPLKQLFEIVKYYPEVSYCDRWIVSGYWMDDAAGNVRHITYKGKLKDGETARSLCNCMNHHMTQKDWLEGAEKVCYSQCGYVTYHVNGKPDATYDPKEVANINFDRPLEKLRVVFDNTPETDPVGLKCTANCIEQSNIIYCSLKCPSSNDSRTTGTGYRTLPTQIDKCSFAEKICADVINYYNQKGWLEGASTVCGQTNGIVEVDFTGSA